MLQVESNADCKMTNPRCCQHVDRPEKTSAARGRELRRSAVGSERAATIGSATSPGPSDLVRRSPQRINTREVPHQARLRGIYQGDGRAERNEKEDESENKQHTRRSTKKVAKRLENKGQTKKKATKPHKEKDKTTQTKAPPRPQRTIPREAPGRGATRRQVASPIAADNSGGHRST